MSTLIEVRKGDGTLVGRCDAKCYKATHTRCTCVCGGINHGCGYKQAIQNNTNRWEEILKGNDGNDVLRCHHQPGLFDQS